MSGTAVLHHAALTPDKMQLLTAWLPSRDWFTGDADDLDRVASYRFVDPDGEVGIETLIVRSNDVTYQVPLTYRDAPLDEARSAFIGTMEHSVLGTRYVYDATGDPVYVAELLRVIREGDTEADLSRGEKTMTVRGSGVMPVANAATPTLRVARVLDEAHVLNRTGALGFLEGEWEQDGQRRTAVVAVLR